VASQPPYATTLESDGSDANAEPKTGWPPKPGSWLQHDPDHIQVASELVVLSSRSNTRIPDPDGRVAALEPIAGSQVWQTGVGGTEVGAPAQEATNKTGPMAARAVSRATSFVFFLLDQAGRTGPSGRHSAAGVAVVSAACLPAHYLAPDVAKDEAGPFDKAVVARSEVGDEAGGPGRFGRFHS